MLQSNNAPDTSSGRYRVSPRTIAFVLASIALMVACVLLALKFFVSERLPELTEGTLEAAMKRWDEQAPPNYDMDIEILGAQPGLVRVEVRDHEVTQETRDGRDPGRERWDVWSVPGMFDTIARDLEIAGDPEKQIQAASGTIWRLRCEFDPKFGYPARYHRLVNSGPEVYWRVTKFQTK